jgi:hypothetical protein
MKSRAGFEESVSSFEQFLAENGYPPCTVWVREQDVVLGRKGALYVRDPLPRSNEREARAKFAAGMQRELGVLFGALCTMGDVTCCYVWTPLDEQESEYRLMPAGTKFSVPSGAAWNELPTGASRKLGRPVKNRLLWQWLEWRHRKLQEHKRWLFQ